MLFGISYYPLYFYGKLVKMPLQAVSIPISSHKNSVLGASRSFPPTRYTCPPPHLPLVSCSVSSLIFLVFCLDFQSLDVPQTHKPFPPAYAPSMEEAGLRSTFRLPLLPYVYSTQRCGVHWLHVPPLLLVSYNRSPSQRTWLSFVQLFRFTRNFRTESEP
jgi:hypothetical protein